MYYCSVCDRARLTWFAGPLALRIGRYGITTFHKWCEYMVTVVLKGDDYTVCSLLTGCWLIWKARSEAVFEGSFSDPLVVSLKTQAAANEFCNFGKDAVNISLKVDNSNFGISHHWLPPNHGQVKINVDGAFDSSTKVAGAGVIFRNAAGMVLDGFGGAWALRKACLMAADSGFSDMVFEFDCAELVDCVNNRKVGAWECDVICKGICSLLDAFPSATVNCISRVSNMAADWLAKSGLKRMCLSPILF